MPTKPEQHEEIIIWFCTCCGAMNEGKPIHCDNCGAFIDQLPLDQRPRPIDLSTPSVEHLKKLTDLVNAFGAEGIWLIRGAQNAALLYDAADPADPANDPVALDIADAGILLIARFPSDGGEPGIETR